jgi:Tol biopolymer transport system component
VWSPDGAFIAFTRRTVYLFNVDDATLQALTTDDRAANHPSWSPNHRHIAFVFYGDCCREILTVDHTNGENHQLFTSAPNQSIGSLSWSPSGQQLLFELADQSLMDDARTSRLVVLDVSGGSLREVVRGMSATPVWWPDR